MTFRPVFLLGMALALCAGLTQADEPPEAATVRHALHDRYPEMTIDSVRTSPIPGVYEAVAGETVFYIDGSGRYAMRGTLVDLQQGVNLTLMTRSALKPIAWRDLPLADSFTIVRGNGKRQLTMFADPDCPYCKRLEQEELPQIDDVTIHVFLYPIAAVHPDAHRKAVSIWCADDRAQAWQDAMLRDKVPDEKTCDNPVDRNVELADRLGINATPTLIFDDGRVVPGLVPLPQVQAMLGRDTP